MKTYENGEPHLFQPRDCRDIVIIFLIAVCVVLYRLNMP